MEESGSECKGYSMYLYPGVYLNRYMAMDFPVVIKLGVYVLAVYGFSTPSLLGVGGSGDGLENTSMSQTVAQTPTPNSPTTLTTHTTLTEPPPEAPGGSPTSHSPFLSTASGFEPLEESSVWERAAALASILAASITLTATILLIYKKRSQKKRCRALH